MTEKELRSYFTETAKSWLGAREGDERHREIIDIYNSHKPLARGVKMSYTMPWCAAFVSAAAIRCGLTDIIPTECGAVSQSRLFMKLGRWEENDSYEPEMGDIIYYVWDDDGEGDNTAEPDHVGIVCEVKNGSITVIEGNKSDSVAYRTLPVNGRFIRGFGLPDFASLADSEADAQRRADIAWAVEKGLILGYGGGEFGWDEPVTRGQLASILRRFSGL